MFLKVRLNGHAGRYRNWPAKPQHEYIADSNWQEVAYGKNAIYRDGHHGNALLSRFSIIAQDNEDISAHPFESRGLLHCVVKLGPKIPELHCINVHLGLFERGRQWQVRALCERIKASVPKGAPLVIAGDFNDWRNKANRALVDQLGVVEVFEAVNGRAARTFPSVMPCSARPHLCARAQVVEATYIAFPRRRSPTHAGAGATFECCPRSARDGRPVPTTMNRSRRVTRSISSRAGVEYFPAFIQASTRRSPRWDRDLHLADEKMQDKCVVRAHSCARRAAGSPFACAGRRLGRAPYLTAVRSSSASMKARSTAALPARGRAVAFSVRTACAGCTARSPCRRTLGFVGGIT